VVVPVNLANAKDVEIIVQNIQLFVKRQVPVRFGLVPTLGSRSSIEQAKLAYYLHDTYGLTALLAYFEDVSCLMVAI
jgi:UDP-glucose:glycoprotein glucosyltransferase